MGLDFFLFCFLRIFFALTTIFYSFKLIFLFRYTFLTLRFRRRLFFRCFLVFFGVFFDLNSVSSKFFDDFIAVYFLLGLTFLLSFSYSIVFCYDIFWKFFGLFRFYLREYELSIFWRFFFFFFFFFKKKKKKKKKKKS